MGDFHILEGESGHTIATVGVHYFSIMQVPRFLFVTKSLSMVYPLLIPSVPLSEKLFQLGFISRSAILTMVSLLPRTSKDFKVALEDMQQVIHKSGVGAKHQNAVAE